MSSEKLTSQNEHYCLLSNIPLNRTGSGVNSRLDLPGFFPINRRARVLAPYRFKLTGTGRHSVRRPLPDVWLVQISRILYCD